MMMVPEPWSHHEQMDPEKRAFYEYHACLMEPWDGPAAIAFTDGVQIGAVLDRNGLRPSRYWVTRDDLVVLASESGVLDLPANRILEKGRLQPGKMFLVDTAQGRIVPDEEIKAGIVTRQALPGVARRQPGAPRRAAAGAARCRRRRLACSSASRVSATASRICARVLAPMAQNGVEAVGSMGADEPLAVLSDQPQLLPSYFKQLFAQVTNPPIDSIREEIITATGTTLGAERNLLKAEPESCRHVELELPLLDDGQLARLKALDRPGLKAATLPILFDPQSGSCRPGGGAGGPLRRRRRGPGRRRHACWSSPTAASTPGGRRSRRCWPWPACTTT